ncbi:hypothetical protein D3C85_1438850 [compost metagenome]
MLGAAEGLIAQEQHPVLEQLRTQLLEQVVVMNRICQIDPGDFGTESAGQLFDVHAVALFR